MGLTTLTLAFGIQTPQRALVDNALLSRVIKLVVVAVIAMAMNVAAQNKKAKPPKIVAVTATCCGVQSKRHISIAESSAVRSP
jgi:hypothetical protein